MEEKDKKHIDEAWKEAIAKERDEVKKAVDEASERPMPEIDFALFVSSLGMQALIGLGEIANPMTNKKETDFAQAKQTIDIISMLAEKTKGNLSEQETKVVETLLYELRLKYVEKAK